MVKPKMHAETFEIGTEPAAGRDFLRQCGRIAFTQQRHRTGCGRGDTPGAVAKEEGPWADGTAQSYP